MFNMKFFLDSADLNQIKSAVDTGMIEGLTTNPSLLAKSKPENVDFLDYVKEILATVDGPVSLEVIATDYEQMLSEARSLNQLAENVVVKLPLTQAGIKAVKTITGEGIKTNVTLVFSATQALLAAKAGATYVSPFVGRLHDAGLNGKYLIEEIRQIYDNYNYQTQILIASDRTVLDTLQGALIGADVITLKYDNFIKLYKHPFTDQGLNKFMQDWQTTGRKSIIEP